MPRIGGNQVNGHRDPNDFYPTHPAWTKALLSSVTIRGPVWEPACGDGAITKVLKDDGFEVYETDIIHGHDFLNQYGSWSGAIITNPPYKLADEFIHHALKLAKQVAMLLPIGALGGQNRFNKLWTINPPATVVVVAARMPVSGKTSQFNHFWSFWDKGISGPTQIIWRKGL